MKHIKSFNEFAIPGSGKIMNDIFMKGWKKLSDKREIFSAFEKDYGLKKYTKDPRFRKMLYCAPVDFKDDSLEDMEKMVEYILNLKKELKVFLIHGFSFLNRYMNEALEVIAHEEMRKIKNPMICISSRLGDKFYLPGENLRYDPTKD